MRKSARIASTTAETAWVPPGREVRVRERRIPGGMLYVGTGLQSVSFPQVEPALIDPALPIDESSGDSDSLPIPFWPSYSTLHWACRATYLEWLEGGRRDLEVDMGFVSLFFYGLERRVLHDEYSGPGARLELLAIGAEVERLLSVYGAEPSFPDRAGEFLDIVRWKAGELWRAPPPLARRGTEPPLALRVAAAQAALAGEPLRAEWALSWALCDPESQLPARMGRCPRELHELFRQRYRERYGAGLQLEPCDRRVDVRYVTESDSFAEPIEISTGLPDVVSMLAPARKLRVLLTECVDALEPYARYLGRGGPPDALLAAALLPVEIFETSAPNASLELRARIDERLTGRENVVCEATDLLEREAAPGSGARLERTTLSAARILERAGFGMEPDPRFGGGKVARGDRVIVFRLEREEDPGRLSPAFTLAALVLKLGVAVAAAAGAVSEEHKRCLRRSIDSGSVRREPERRRLAARLESLLLRPATLAGLKKGIDALTLSLEERRQVGRFLVQVAWADGGVDPREVKMLSKAYRLLGQDPGAVHQDVHEARATPPSRGPVAVQAASQLCGYTIPTPRPNRLAGGSSGSSRDDDETLRLDPAAIDRKLEETAAVSTLLARVFAEEEPEPGPSSAREGGAVPGLDAPHSKLLRHLGARREWSRPEYDELARSLGLLPDGALDLLNDVAFEVADAPLTEGEDPIEIDLDVCRELTS